MNKPTPNKDFNRITSAAPLLRLGAPARANIARSIPALVMALLLSIPAGISTGEGPEGTLPLSADLLEADEPPLAVETLPDLSGHLMPPVDAGPSSTITVVVRIGNAGAPSGPSNASVMLESASARTLVQSFPVPALERHEQFSHEFTWEAPSGLSRLALAIDPDGAVQESREDNNRATSWVNRDYGEPIDAAEPIRFETPGGSQAHPQGIATEWSDNTFTLRLHPQGNAPVQTLVHQAWLDSRLGSSSLDGVAFEIVERDGEPFYAFEAPAGGPGSFIFRSFAPVQGTERFTRGSIATLLLDERPMFLRLAAVPATAPEGVARETPNGTVMARAPTPPPRLDLSFEGASHAGQGIWIHRDFLAGFGFADARFQHEDGTPVLATAIGDYYHLEPAHFSIIQVFTYGSENFETVNAQPYSAVYGDGDSGFQRLVILSDRQDASDESLLRDFVPHQQYTLSASAGVVWQGNWQVAHPLAIGNRAERTNPAANTIVPTNAMGFYYNARDCNLLQSPLIVAYYRGASGTETTVWSQTGAASPGCNSPLNWNFNLRLRVTPTTTYFEFLNSAQTVLQSTGVANALLPTALDAIFLGSEDRCNCGYEPTAELWTDDIRVDGIAGNFVNEDFGALSTGWTYTGSAVRNTDYVRLTPASANQVGTVRFNTPLTASRFSAEFSYRIGPDSSGADGMTFFFYKNNAYTPAIGGSMGFQDNVEPSNSGHEGYGFVLDGYQNSEYGELAAESIGIAKDHMDDSTRYLYYGTGIQKADAAWHTINIDVFESKIVVYQDGAYKFTYSSPISRSYSGIGFSAGTGGLANYHDVDAVRISVPASGGSVNNNPPSPQRTSPTEYASVTANPTLQWNSVTDPDGDPVDYAVDFGTINPPPPYTTTSGTSISTTTLPGTTYYWRVTARDNRNGASTPQTAWQFTTASAASGLSQNFDSGIGSWSLQSPWNLESRTGKYTSAPNAAWYGFDDGSAPYDYNNGATNSGSMTSPAFGVPASNPVLTFKSWHQTEPTLSYDRREVHISTNGGSTWTCLATSYGGPPPYCLTSPVTQAQTVLSTSMNQWNTESISLSSYAGQTVKLRFYFDTLDSTANSYEGWFVDDISVATVVNNPPNTPSNPSPTYPNAPPQPITSLNLGWTGGDQDAGQAVTYTVYFGTANPPTTAKCSNIPTTTCATGALALGTTYNWKVVASDGIAPLVEGPVWSFMTNRAPNAASNPTPGPNAVDVVWNPTVSWTGGDPDGQSVSYTVHRRVGTTGSFAQACSIPATFSTSLSCPWSGLSRNTVYQWYVVATDSMGASTSGVSSPWTFTTKANTVPPAPTGPSPTNGAIDQLASLTLAWTTPADADGDTLTRRVYFGTTNPPTTLKCGPSTTMTTCTVSGLARGVVYYWKVEVQDGFPEGVNQATWSFTTKPNTPPPTCLVLSNSYLTVTARHECTDADSDPLTYEFNWGDGWITNVAASTNYPNPPPTHTYAGDSYCPVGNVQVTVSVSDGYVTSTQGQSLGIQDHRDEDVDGLLKCREAAQGTLDILGHVDTRDRDHDSVGEGIQYNIPDDVPDRGIVTVGSDYVESTWFPGHGTVFCPSGAPANCAPNPRHKDIYVEIDTVDPVAERLPAIEHLVDWVDYFRTAPMSNPDGVDGVTLHIDAGPTRAGFNLGDGGENVGDYDGHFGGTNCDQTWNRFDDITAVYQAPAREHIFHYGLIVDFYCPDGKAGVARGIPHHDFVMAGNSGASEDFVRSIFMHEIGHNLGLEHSGIPNQPNWKPNYLSVMNYRTIYDRDGLEFHGYSTRAVPQMDEAAMRENRGWIQDGGVTSDLTSYLNQFMLWSDCPDGKRRLEFTGYTATADFDCNGAVLTTGTVVANVNGHTSGGEDVGSTRKDGSIVATDCVTGSTAGCDRTMGGHRDFPPYGSTAPNTFVFSGLSRVTSYGAAPGESDPTPFKYVRVPATCVNWPAGGRMCTEL